jgi:hypothetical protein
MFKNKVMEGKSLSSKNNFINPLSVAPDMSGTHDTSLGALPSLYSVESTHL